MEPKNSHLSKTVRKPIRPLTKVNTSIKVQLTKSSTITPRTQVSSNPESSINSPKLPENQFLTPLIPVQNSSDLINSLKSTLSKLQEESKNYKFSIENSKKQQISETQSRELITLPDTLDSENKSSSFFHKISETSSSLAELQTSIKKLNSKISDSELKVKKSNQDSLRLKKVVHEIEEKLEKRKIFREEVRSAPCGTNCQII